jgi:hypothetical protein
MARLSTPATWAQGLGSLGLAHALAWLAALGAATVYAGWLTPAQFAHWAGTLALARAALLLLDGGLKTALVRRAQWPGAAALARAQHLATGLALGLPALAVVPLAAAVAHGRLDAGLAGLAWIGTAAYLLSYPPMWVALARSSRAGRFGAVGRAEGAATALEFLLPLPLLAAGLPYWAAFAAGMVAGRAWRCVAVVRAARALAGPADIPRAEAPGATQGLLREGQGVQAVALLSMLRDQQHLWLLGLVALALPALVLGAAGAGSASVSEWIGRYAFAMTACAFVSQVAAQTAARVALPWLAAAPAAERWALVLVQARWLAIATLPLLALLPAWLHALDGRLWQGRWAEAIALVPWLALRMVGGAAITALGAWLLVQRTPWQTAVAHARWTAAEVLLGAAAIAAWGAPGLAVAAAAGVWIGLAVFVAADGAAAPARRLVALLRQVLLRPSLAAAGLLALSVQAGALALAAATLALPLVWLLEPALRDRLAVTWARLRGPARVSADRAAP